MRIITKSLCCLGYLCTGHVAGWYDRFDETTFYVWSLLRPRYTRGIPFGVTIMEIPLKPTLSFSSSAPVSGRRESESYRYTNIPLSPDNPGVPPLPPHRQHRHHHHRHHHHNHTHRPRRDSPQPRGVHTPEANATAERVSSRIVESGLESPVQIEEGLRWKYAREQIWATAERILAAKLAALPPVSVKVYKALRLGMNYLIVYCFLVLLIAYSVGTSQRSISYPDLTSRT